ncbi:MAG TPA: hypothetical protein VF692_02670 [Pyrinomonadaceae bacterium]
MFSAEWYSRTTRRATGAVVVNESEEFSYMLDIDPQGLASRYEMITPQPGKPPFKLSYRLHPDLRTGENSGQKNLVTEQQGIAAYYDQAPVGMLEQVVRRARIIGGERVKLPVFRFVGKKTIPAIIVFKNADSAEVEIGGKVFYPVVDREGRILAGQIPAYGITIERLDSLPAAAYVAWAAYGTRLVRLTRLKRCACRRRRGILLPER